jgi:hypothetical protein
MSNDSRLLELRYQRLLLAYPRAYRQANGQEMLGVLMASARDGQRRPGLGDAANLVQFGLLARVRTGHEPSADKRWRDGLALFSLVAPVLMLVPATINLFQDGVYYIPLVQAAMLAIPGLLGWRKVSLAVLALKICNSIFWVGALPFYFLGFHLGGAVFGPENSFYLAFLLLDGIALIWSDGPRRGRQLLTWPGAIGLLAVGVLLTPLGMGNNVTADLIELAALIAALAILAGSSRAGRQVAVLLSLMLYPFALIFATVSWRTYPPAHLPVYSAGWLALLYLPEAAIACLIIVAAAGARRAGGTPAQPGPSADADG